MMMLFVLFDADDVMPSFLSVSQDLAVFAGDTVEIRCTVSNLRELLQVHIGVLEVVGSVCRRSGNGWMDR